MKGIKQNRLKRNIWWRSLPRMRGFAPLVVFNIEKEHIKDNNMIVEQPECTD